MMWQKARLFGASPDLCAMIVTASPRDARRLGREVPGFSETIWAIAARPIVAEGNYAKFTQNPGLLRRLLDTDGTTLAEASPFDRIWGIGLTADDPRAMKRSSWRGTNWLGEVLADVRDTLLRARAQIGCQLSAALGHMPSASRRLPTLMRCRGWASHPSDL